MKKIPPTGTNYVRRVEAKDASTSGKGHAFLELVKGGATYEIDEEMLIRACQRGDQEAMEILYKTYAPKAFAFLTRIVGPYHRSLEDMVHDVFLEVLKSIKRFRFESKFTTWLYKLTIRVTLRNRMKLQRETKRIQELSSGDAPAGPFPSPITALLQEERNARLWKLLNHLPEEKRVALILSEAEGLSAQEIAEITDSKIETVYSRIHYARKVLYEKLVKDRYFNDEEDVQENPHE